MIIDIPDKLITDLLECSPDTPVEEAIESFFRYRSNRNALYTFAAIGEHCLRKGIDTRKQKS